MAAEHSRTELRTAKDLVHIRQLHLPITLPAVFGSEMTGPQSPILHDLLQRTNRFLVEHARLVVDHVLAGERKIKRFDLGLHELANPFELFREVRVDAEIGHGQSPSSMSVTR